MRTVISTLSALLCVMALFACASATVETRTYIPNQMQSISSWYIDFEYQNGAVEKQQYSNGSSNVKLVSEGQDPADLQFRDDLFYGLRDDHSIPMTKNADQATGRIEILPVHAVAGGFLSVEVIFLNKQGNTVARMKVSNCVKVSCFKGDAEFTTYATETIADFILNK